MSRPGDRQAGQGRRTRFFPGPTDGTKTRLPGDFLIDEQGVLRDVFYGRDIAEHLPFERVEAFLR
jgi:hypothetical protein